MISKFFGLVGIPLLLAACDSGKKWRSGRYAVYWIDEPAKLQLGLDLGNGSMMGRVPAPVIAVGDDSKWVVAASHPNGDTARTDYYYFAKASDDLSKNSAEVIQGPLSEAAFDEKKRTLHLPEFSKRFR